MYQGTAQFGPICDMYRNNLTKYEQKLLRMYAWNAYTLLLYSIDRQIDNKYKQRRYIKPMMG